jgi:hypothetical protein
MARDVFAAVSKTGSRVGRCRLLEITPSGLLRVKPLDRSADPFLCDWLETGGGPVPRLEAGDVLLVVPPTKPGTRGCVLGRVGRYVPPADAEAGATEAMPEVMVVQAEQQLVLTCGESQIILRHDGKVLIKGIDVVSRATRTQKIKGGSVQIN